MAMSPEFRDYILELLEPFGPVRAKRMFGGAGLHLDGTIFAILAYDTIYLKVDDDNRPDFEAEDMGPFDPFKDGKRMIRSYFECPARLLEDPEELCDWARKAWRAGRRADAAKTEKKTRKTTPKVE